MNSFRSSIPAHGGQGVPGRRPARRGRLRRHLAMDDLPHRGPGGIQPAGPLQGPLAVRRERRRRPRGRSSRPTPRAGRSRSASSRRCPAPDATSTRPWSTRPSWSRTRSFRPARSASWSPRSASRCPEGTYLVDAKGYRGILRKVLTPGRYRINKYGYDVKVVDVDACAEPSTRVKHKADDPTLIPPGYVGVVTNKASDPLTGAGPRHPEQVLQPGIYFLNPEEKRIDIVSIGYSETSLTGRSPPGRRRAGAGAARPGQARSRGDRLGTSTADDPVYVAGQGDRVSLERRLPDSPRLHGDLGHSARAGAATSFASSARSRTSSRR